MFGHQNRCWLLCKDDDSDVRLAAARALGSIGDARAVDPLLAWLKKDQEERRTAAFVLGEIGSPRPVEVLIEMLEAPVFEDRQVAAKALVKIYRKQPADETCRALLSSVNEKPFSPGILILIGNLIRIDCSTCYGPSAHTDQGIGIEFPL